jgi:hypothetical protein
MEPENRLVPDSDLFPLRTVGDVRKLFERHLRRLSGDADVTKAAESVSTYSKEPNLALLSIVAGAIENWFDFYKPVFF